MKNKSLQCIPHSLKIPKNVKIVPPITRAPKNGGGSWDGFDEKLNVLTQALVDAASALAAKLGQAWRGRIFYNLGWHWGVQRGGYGSAIFTISSSGNGYSANLSRSCGSNNFAYAKNPRTALKLCVENQRERVAAEQKLLDDALDVLLSEP